MEPRWRYLPWRVLSCERAGTDPLWTHRDVDFVVPSLTPTHQPLARSRYHQADPTRVLALARTSLAGPSRPRPEPDDVHAQLVGPLALCGEKRAAAGQAPEEGARDSRVSRGGSLHPNGFCLDQGRAS